MGKMGFKRACEYMAKQWDNASPNSCGEYRIITEGVGVRGACYGICEQIFHIAHKVTRKSRDKIITRLRLHPKYKQHEFIWSHSKSGVKARAKFLRKIAKEAK